MPASERDHVPRRIAQTEHPCRAIPRPLFGGAVEIGCRVVDAIHVSTPIIEAVIPVVEALLAGVGPIGHAIGPHPARRANWRVTRGQGSAVQIGDKPVVIPHPQGERTQVRCAIEHERDAKVRRSVHAMHRRINPGRNQVGQIVKPRKRERVRRTVTPIVRSPIRADWREHEVDQVTCMHLPQRQHALNARVIATGNGGGVPKHSVVIQLPGDSRPARIGFAEPPPRLESPICRAAPAPNQPMFLAVVDSIRMHRRLPKSVPGSGRGRPAIQRAIPEVAGAIGAAAAWKRNKVVRLVSRRCVGSFVVVTVEPSIASLNPAGTPVSHRISHWNQHQRRVQVKADPGPHLKPRRIIGVRDYPIRAGGTV